MYLCFVGLGVCYDRYVWRRLSVYYIDVYIISVFLEIHALRILNFDFIVVVILFPVPCSVTHQPVSYLGHPDRR